MSACDALQPVPARGERRGIRRLDLQAAVSAERPEKDAEVIRKRMKSEGIWLS
ncbi:MAG: hypothetical protein P8Z78_12895 [Gammaproteobacteria bacterium]